MPSANQKLGALPRACVVHMPVLLLLAAGSPPAAAQDAGLAEVVVTAQKRAERVQDVPISDSVVTLADVQDKGITDTIGLQAAVPGMVINHTAAEGNFFIRGVGTNLYGPAAEQTVAMFVDGVYLASAEANMFSFNNIERVEVLKGPQGTLFGRNTTGGVIQIITRDPSQTFGGDVSVGYANFDTVTGSGYVTGGLTSNLAADLAVQYENQGIGWGHNFTIGEENASLAKGNWAFRSKWKFTPTDTTTLKLILSDSRQYLQYNYQLVPGVVSPIVPSQGYAGHFNSFSNIRNYEYVRARGASFHVDQDAGPVHIVNIVSYAHTTLGYVLDNDTTPSTFGDIAIPSLAHNWTEEFQVQSQAASKIKWVVGAFYFDAYGAFVPVDVSHGAALLYDHQTTRSASGFGQATVPIIDGTNLTLGARYTSDKQNFIGTTYFGGANAGTFAGSQAVSKTTWRVAIDHHFTDDVMAYASQNRGFKSGGFNAFSFASVNSYEPETLDAYEVGLKTEWFEHRLRWNSAAFLYNYSNLQVEVPVVGGQITGNGPRARIKGVETEIQAKPMEKLELTAAATYLDARYTRYPNALAISPSGNLSTIDAAGNYVGSAPKVTANVGANYSLMFKAGTLQPNVSVSYNNGYVFYADNRLVQPSYWLLNTSLTWYAPEDAWSVQVWGKNLNNEVWYMSRSEQAGQGDVQRLAAPRTFGVTLRTKF